MRWGVVSLAVVTLLAAALRWFRIDAQSLWYDEGISAHQLTRSFAEIVRASALDTHPPLYYWTLKAWGETVGASELGLRSLSAVCGVGVVVLSWFLGRRLFGVLVASLTGVLLAAAPLGVYYSQEVRMYAQVTALGMLAVYAYARTLGLRCARADSRRPGPQGDRSSPSDTRDGGGERSSRNGSRVGHGDRSGVNGSRLGRRGGLVRANGWYIVYALAAAATLYTQYLGAAFLVACNMHALLWWKQRSPRDWLRWLAANAAAALAFVPWLPTFIDQQTHALNVSPRTPAGLALMTLDAYGGGLAQGELFVWGGAALVGLAAVGCLLAVVQTATPLHSTRGVTQTVTRTSQNVTPMSQNASSASPRAAPAAGSVTWLSHSVTQGVTWGPQGVTPSVTWTPESVTQGATWVPEGVTQGVTPGQVTLLEPPSAVTHPSELPAAAPRAQPDTRALQAATLALLIWLLPLGLVLYLGLRSGLFEPRYLVLSLPGLCLRAASALAGLAALTALPARALPAHALPTRARAAPALLARLPVLILSFAATALLLVPAAQGLIAQYFDPALARDDYRDLVATIESQAQPTDAIVLSAPNQVEVFDYYYHGPLPVIGLPAQRPIDPSDTQARLAQLKHTYGRVWLVEWAINEADPPGVILTWLSQNGFQASHAWYGSVQLALIGFGSANAPVHQLDLPLSNGITLEGYQLPADTLRPGDTLELTLFWRAGAGPTAERWKVFTHILDQNSQVVAQRDAEPGDTLRPTTTWEPREEIKDNYGISVPADVAPGDYTLEIGMYNGETRADFDSRGNHLELGTIHIVG